MSWDLIIIGSGFGGSVSALRLVEKGYRVLLLEQGWRLEPRGYPVRFIMETLGGTPTTAPIWARA